MTLDIPDRLKARVEAIASRSSLSPSQVIADALENGYTLEWQERFLDRVTEGIEAAEKGEFASPDEVLNIVHKYRPS